MGQVFTRCGRSVARSWGCVMLHVQRSYVYGYLIPVQRQRQLNLQKNITVVDRCYTAKGNETKKGNRIPLDISDQLIARCNDPGEKMKDIGGAIYIYRTGKHTFCSEI